MTTSWKLTLATALVLALAACGTDEATPIDTSEEDTGAPVELDMGSDETPDTGGPEPQDMDTVDSSIVFPDLSYPPLPRSVETTVVSPVRVGDPLSITCRLLDERGDVVEPEVPPTFTIAVAPEGSFVEDAGNWIGTRAGVGTVRCAAPSLGLVDVEPAEVEVLPGEPRTSAITVDSAQIVAGDTVTATCTYYDAYGNEVDPADDNLESSLNITPQGGGVDVVDHQATITEAGVYTLSCFVPGLDHEQAVSVEVVPGLPASLVVTLAPNQQVYGLDQVVGVSYIVSDQYGNVIPDAKVTMTVDQQSGWTTFGTGRFRFSVEGTYVVTVTVEGPTETGIPLTQNVTIVVNGEGPAIECGDPVDGSMVDGVPGQPLTFTGSVNDANGVDSLLVDGQGVTVQPDGSFSAQVNPQWGINFVEVVATDEFGEENSRSCAFLLSNHWSGESDFMDHAVVLKMLQGAIDDGNPADLDSLNDLLHAVVNSPGIVDEVDTALEAANPLQPETCVTETCIFGFCVCWFGWGLEYDGDIRVGPATTSLQLVPGGVRANARIEDFGVKVYVPYTVSEIDGSTRGWVTTDYIDVTLTIDLELINGKPRASIRPNSVSVEVGDVSTQFNGLDGAIVNLVVALFNGTVRNLIADTLRGFVEDSFDEVIDGVVSSLDIDTLGTTFNVPTLDGSGTVGVRFNLQFSRLWVSNSRFAVGIGTRFRPTLTRNGNASLGVPRLQSSVWGEPSITRPIGVGVFVGVLNHVLHALWRGGLFDATITGADLGGGLPAAATAVIGTSLPPVVENLSDGTVQLSLGGMNVALTYPGIFDEPLNVTLGARASASVSVSGDDLIFGSINIEELFFSTSDVSLDATTRSVLEGFLRSLIQSVVDTSLNQSLPALPIPTFSIPSSLSQYGLPANAVLGINNPTLEVDPRHYLLQGSFGVR